MAINCFRKENLYCMWDDNLEGKHCACADSLGTLIIRLEMEGAIAQEVAPSMDPSYPFSDAAGHIWRFAYILEPPTDDINNDAVKNAYIQGHTVLRRFGDDEEWEATGERSYFDLPGYEYKVEHRVESRVSNKALAEWLIRGMGLLINTESRRICTSYDFPADEMYGEVPSGYKVMPIGTDDWLEPTEEVISA